MPWIKIRTGLCDDPAIVGMANTLGIDEHAVVGRLIKIWSWADANTIDGYCENITYEWVDLRVSCKGFALAMQKVGWLSRNRSGWVSFPNWDTHMGANAKKRADAADRQRKRRSASSPTEPPCHKNVTKDCDKSVTREEKRRDREEKSKTKSAPSGRGENPPKGYTPEFEAWWKSYPSRPGCPKGNKTEAFTAWNAIGSPESHAKVLQATKALSASDCLPKDAQRFLRPVRGKGDPEYLRWLDIEPPPSKADLRHGNIGKTPGDPDIIAKLRLRGTTA